MAGSAPGAAGNMPTPLSLLLPMVAAAYLAASVSAATSTYLTLDPRNIITQRGVELRLGAVDKHPSNPVLKEDKPWELRFDNTQPSVWVDPADGKYKLWYNMFSTCSPMSAPVCQSGAGDTGVRPKPAGIGGPVPCNGSNQLAQAKIHGRTGSLCYAESADGLVWEKPGLGLVPFVDGQGKHHPAAATNIILGTGLGYPHNNSGPPWPKANPKGGHYPTGNGVTLDERPGEAPWKMLGVDYIATSWDGLNWGNRTAMPPGRWDSHLNVQWEHLTQRWVAYARASPTQVFPLDAGYPPVGAARIQSFSASKSPDFLGEWGEIVPTGLNTSEFYQPDALVSFAYEGIYLGFSNIISFNSTAVERGQGPGWLKNPGGTVTSELVFSTDARHWRYLVPGQSFIPRGRAGTDWDCCSIFTAKQGFAPSQQQQQPQPQQQPAAHHDHAGGINSADTQRVYYGGCNGPFFGSRGCALGLATMQKHGWAGLSAVGAEAGHVEVAPVHVTRKTVLLTLDAPGEHGIRVGCVGDPNRTLASSIELKGKLTEAPALWAGGLDLSPYMVLDTSDRAACGAVTLEFLIPPGATLFAYTV